ncbi:MAG: DUF1697 domain-containing protein [Usitatibacter sp.]
MPRFAAFLRAVNVGGNNIVPMAALRQRLEAGGFRAVRTYLASGNVTFDMPGTADAAARRIEKQIESWLGLQVAVMARKLERLVELQRSDPFAGLGGQNDTRLYVAFLAGSPPSKPQLPLVYGSDGLEVVGIEEREAFIVSRPVGAGRHGFPSLTLEKALGVASTLRNWNTLERIVKSERQP